MINIFCLFNDCSKVVLVVVVMFNGIEEEGREVFRVFYDIGLVMELVKWVLYDVVN